MNINKQKEILKDLMLMYPTFKTTIKHPMDTLLREVSKLQFHTLLILKNTGALNMSNIANETCVSVQQLTKIINSLEAKGFVERFTEKSNRRQVWVKITNLGIELLNRHLEETIENMIPDFSKLSDEDMITLQESANKITKIITKLSK